MANASTQRILVTMGDVAGVGPEILAKAWPTLTWLCHPIVVGDPGWMRNALRLVGSDIEVQTIDHPRDATPKSNCLPCVNGSDRDLSVVQPGEVSADAGRAAFDFLCRAIDLALAGEAEGIVTAPLHKEGLRAAGLPYPGHTEILAERTGVEEFAMVLALDVGQEREQWLAVAHVTLHMALRDVFGHITSQAVEEKIALLDELMRRLLGRRPRLGVAALNPHASDGGLFGDEEARIIAPGVERARQAGFDATGPFPADSLFVRAEGGEFDGIVAMYHDQGHIALKLLGQRRAINICAGLPIVRTSVAHGTAYDIAGQGIADPSSLIEATRLAQRLCREPS